MKEIKMKIKLILLIVLFLIMGINKSYAADEINQNIVLSAETEQKVYQKDDIIKVEIKISSIPKRETGENTQINVLNFLLDYDEDILEINKIYDEDEDADVDDMKSLRGWNLNYDEETKSVLLINEDFYSNTDETILRMNFKVKKDFYQTSINLNEIEASGGAGVENNFKGESDIEIKVQGKEEEPKEEDFYLRSNIYRIGEKDITQYEDGDKYITKALPGTKISDFLKGLDTNGTITIYNADGSEVTNTDDIVKTGMTLKDVKEGYEDINMTIVVMGDANGNGRIDTGDLTKLRSKLYENGQLTELEGKALDITFTELFNTKILTILRNVLYNSGILEDLLT